MTLRIANLSECPPGGFRYRIPEDNKLIGPHIVYRDLRAEVCRYYALTDRLAPSNLDDKIHAFMCAQIGLTYCRDSDANRLLVPNPRSTLPLRFFSVVQGTKTIGEWFVKGRLLHRLSLVDPVQSTTRARTCSTCSHNVPISGCAACVAGQLNRAIAAIVGNASTPLDAQLQACDLCGCSLKAKVWFPLDLLRKHMTYDQLAAFPPHCWLVTENTAPQI
jgi:hypothetical protein